MKKDFWAPVIIVLLSMAFAIITLIVFLHPSLRAIRLKMRTGAILLTLTGMISCNQSETLCYQQSVNNKDSSDTGISRQSDGAHELGQKISNVKKSSKLESSPRIPVYSGGSLGLDKEYRASCYGAPKGNYE